MTARVPAGQWCGARTLWRRRRSHGATTTTTTTRQLANDAQSAHALLHRAAPTSSSRPLDMGSHDCVSAPCSASPRVARTHPNATPTHHPPGVAG